MKKECKPKICEQCGFVGTDKIPLDVHHIDENHKNNKPENLKILCVLCHAKLHGIEPRLFELKRLVKIRDRLILMRNVVTNQQRGFGRIEMDIPIFWSDNEKEITSKIKETEKMIKALVPEYKIWDWLSKVYGVSEVTAAKIISAIDINKTPSVAALWRYCGLDATRVKRKTGKGALEWNKQCGSPYLKKELVGVLGKVQFIRKKSEYRNVYDVEKAKQLANGLPKGHSHNRAIRKAVKTFLTQLWLNWRKIEGLSVSEPYVL